MHRETAETLITQLYAAGARHPTVYKEDREVKQLLNEAAEALRWHVAQFHDALRACLKAEEDLGALKNTLRQLGGCKND